MYSELLYPNGVSLKEGELLKQPQLANTLQFIAQLGADYFYKSSFTEELISELESEHGSILTLDDFHNYEVVTREALSSAYGEFKVHSFPPPASGPVLALVFNILQGKCYTDVYVVSTS